MPTNPQTKPANGPEPVIGPAAACPTFAADVRALLQACGPVFTSEEIDTACDMAAAPDDDYEFLAAYDGKTLAAYSCYGTISFAPGRYDLYWIAAAPGYQGAGLGRRMLAATEGAIAAAGGALLYAETSSLPAYAAARGFYIRSGFTIAATLSDFYAEGVSKIIYAKRIMR